MEEYRRLKYPARLTLKVGKNEKLIDYKRVEYWVLVTGDDAADLEFNTKCEVDDKHEYLVIHFTSGDVRIFGASTTKIFLQAYDEDMMPGIGIKETTVREMLRDEGVDDPRMELCPKELLNERPTFAIFHALNWMGVITPEQEMRLVDRMDREAQRGKE